MKKILFALLIISITSVPADDFRCNVFIITKGMRMYQVIEKCGEPLYKEKVGEILKNNAHGVIKTYVYELVYKCEGKPRILTFHGSILVKIELEK